jgi:hypothetical protein
VPTGIGNNETGYDLALLQQGNIDEDREELEEEEEPEEPPDELEMARELARDDWDLAKEAEEAPGPKEQKRKHRLGEDDSEGEKKPCKSVVNEKKPTGPCAGKSTPARPTTRKKATTGIERFADVAAREEETTQKALELKKMKFRGETDKAVAKLKAQAEIQMNKDKLRAEYAQKKLELEFKLEFQRAQMGMASAQRFSNFSGSQSAFGTYNNFSSNQGSNSFSSGAGWQTTPASSSESTPWSDWSSTQASGPYTSISALVSESPTMTSAQVQQPDENTATPLSRSFTQQLNAEDDDDDLYA